MGYFIFVETLLSITDVKSRKALILGCTELNQRRAAQCCDG